MKKINCAVVLLLGMLLAVSHGSTQASDDSLLALAIDLAETPEHHLVIAEHYRGLAREARSQIEVHKAMRTSYRHRHSRFKAGLGADQAMVRHCDQLIELYESVAKEYESLAAIHEADAE